MQHPEGFPIDRTSRKITVAIAAMTSAVAVAFILPVAAQADPPPEPPPSPGNTAGPPLDPNAAPPPLNQNAAPPPADPNAPPPAEGAPPPPPEEPGRVNNAPGAFSFVVPAGWTSADASRLTYGSALLTRAPAPGSTVVPPATDASILLGKLDLKLFAGAEPDNTKAAIRLASDMGEFFMPFPGTRINQETIPLNANGQPGAASYYEVKFTDTAKPNGQIWAGVVGTQTPRVIGQQQPRNDRWFVVWLGNANNPIDKGAAKALTESIRPWTPPPPPEAPPPGEPGAPGAPPPAGQPGAVGVPVPVNPEQAPGMMPPS